MYLQVFNVFIDSLLVYCLPGLAYAMLASLPAVTGLYTAFVPILVYMAMGTSRHISLGKHPGSLLSIQTLQIQGFCQVGHYEGPNVKWQVTNWKFSSHPLHAI